MNFRNFHRKRYEYTHEWVNDVIASQFSMYLVRRNDEIPVFQLWESKTCRISTLNKCRIMFALVYFDMGTCFYMFEIFFKVYIKNTWKIVRRWDHELTHLHIHIDCSRKVFLKITKIQTVTSSLFFIRFTSNIHCSIRNVLLFLLN